MRSFARLTEVNPGFNPHDAHIASVFLPRPAYSNSRQHVLFAEPGDGRDPRVARRNGGRAWRPISLFQPAPDPHDGDDAIVHRHRPAPADGGRSTGVELVYRQPRLLPGHGHSCPARSHLRRSRRAPTLPAWLSSASASPRGSSLARIRLARASQSVGRSHARSWVSSPMSNPRGWMATPASRPTSRSRNCPTMTSFLSCGPQGRCPVPRRRSARRSVAWTRWCQSTTPGRCVISSVPRWPVSGSP